MTKQQPRVVVIGLGYVGLPLAVALAKSTQCWGLDVSVDRITELTAGYDRTGEIDQDRLAASSLHLTSNPADCPAADFYIVTVPTPIDDENRPDLSLVIAASNTVGAMLDRARQPANPPASQPIVIYESTFYPGVTEDICAPQLAATSGLICGEDFFVAYSPERINPGDREHTIDKITKVVAGQTPDVLEKVAALYGAVTSGGVYRAASIKAAEAAKVIENAQRDINIAFMNEITQIFRQMDLSIWDVLSAANTKWNFLDFSPGLVGGHCIGVDPFYLSHRARELGHYPRVILSGRTTNDGMAGWLATQLHAQVQHQPSEILVMGLTFKENVPDIRNSKVFNVIAALRALGHTVTAHDPHANAHEIMHEYAIEADPAALERSYDMVLFAVPHAVYFDSVMGDLARLVRPGGVVADIKNAIDPATLRPDVRYWRF